MAQNFGLTSSSHGYVGIVSEPSETFTSAPWPTTALPDTANKATIEILAANKALMTCS